MGLWSALFVICVGVFFLVHCTIAGRRELRSGKALGGRFGNHDRAGSPVGFWLVIAGTFGAAVMGLLLMSAGFVGLLASLGH
jgi:hypothetical protein